MNLSELDLPEIREDQSVLGYAEHPENIGEGKILRLGVGEICVELDLPGLLQGFRAVGKFLSVLKVVFFEGEELGVDVHRSR